MVTGVHDKVLISVNVYCPHKGDFWSYWKSYYVLFSCFKMGVLPFLNVALTVLVTYRSWERSNYKLVKYLILRDEFHKVMIQSLVSGARLWCKESDLPGLHFLICRKRSHSIGRIKWINTTRSKNQTANTLLLWDNQYGGFILQAFINYGYIFC